VLTVSIFAVGTAIAGTGVLYRLALWAVGCARGGLSGQSFALGTAGLMIGAALPNATGRTTIVGPLIAEIAEALGLAPGSPARAGLAMAALVGFGLMVAPFQTSSSTALLATALLPESTRAGLSWSTWAVRAAPAHAVIFFGLLAWTCWRFRPGRAGSTHPTRDAARSLALQRALLGPLSQQERVVGLVTLGLLIAFATQPLHGVDPVWVGVAAAAVLASSGALTTDSLRSVNWSFLLLFGTLISVADVFRVTNVDRWLAGLVVGMLGGLVASPVLFVSALTLLCFGLSLVLRWQAAVPLLTITLGPIASGAGIDPWVVALVALVACNGFVLPYQSTIYLALHQSTGGRLFTHAQARPIALAYWALVLAGLCLSVPIWHVMGLL
jgi:DASS family divalent anion:Na+ symporter